MRKRTKIILISLASVLVCIIAAVFIYFSIYYKAVDVESYLNSDDNVSVEKIKDGFFFDSSENDKALIFYPGAKVDTKAYAPLCHEIAKSGYDVFLIDMPFHFAIFGVNKADKIIENYNYESYYIAGHSLGGAMAANYAYKNASKLKGLLLLAAYSTKDLSDTNLIVLSIYGENDGVLNRGKVEAGRALMPTSYYEYIIQGGNHAQFGSYGKQKKDNDASISTASQIEETVSFIDKNFN